MPRFNVGDRVRCIEAPHNNNPRFGVVGQEYTVYHVDGNGHIKLLDSGLCHKRRFELVIPPVPVPVAEPVQARRQKVLYIILYGNDADDPEWQDFDDENDAEDYVQQCREDGDFIAFKKVTLNY